MMRSLLAIYAGVFLACFWVLPLPGADPSPSGGEEASSVLVCRTGATARAVSEEFREGKWMQSLGRLNRLIVAPVRKPGDHAA